MSCTTLGLLIIGGFILFLIAAAYFGPSLAASNKRWRENQ